MTASLKNRILAADNVPAAIEVLLESFAERQSVLTAIQVGACKGDGEGDPLHPFVRNRPTMESHLIEAVNSLYVELVESMDPQNNPNIHCYNLVIGANDERRSFFSVSDRYAIDFPEAPSWKKYQIGSLTDHHLRDHVPGEYIQRDEVRCVSPKTFMELAQIGHGELNLLVTDTEGFDGEIVSAFLEHARPEVLAFEHHVMPADEYGAVLALLEAHGYGHKEVGNDTIAARD